MTEIGIEQARKSLGDIANRAQLTGAITYLTRNGRRIAAVVPLELTMQNTEYTVTIEAANADQTIWQALEAAEPVTAAEIEQDGGPEAYARWVASNQTAATGPGAWRVQVRQADGAVVGEYVEQAQAD